MTSSNRSDLAHANFFNYISQRHQKTHSTFCQLFCRSVPLLSMSELPPTETGFLDKSGMESISLVLVRNRKHILNSRVFQHFAKTCWSLCECLSQMRFPPSSSPLLPLPPADLFSSWSVLFNVSFSSSLYLPNFSIASVCFAAPLAWHHLLPSIPAAVH